MRTKLLLFNPKYSILAVLLTTAALVCVWAPVPAVLASPVFILWIVFFGYFLGAFFLPKEGAGWQTLFGVLGLVSAVMIFLSGVYWFFAFTKITATIAVVLFPFLISFLPEPDEPISAVLNFSSQGFLQRPDAPARLIAGLAMLGDIVLLFILLSRRFGDTLISPWTLVGPKFFLLFFLTTALLAWSFQRIKTERPILPLIIHTGLILNVSYIVFKHGFGFDPFIHLASERHILEFGVITPKQPYYIGQYVLDLFMHKMTHAPLQFIHMGLVPIAASIIAPLVSFFALARAGFQKQLLPAVLLLSLVPLIFFTVTTPNNLAQLLAFIVAFWMWYETAHGSWRTHLLGALLVGATCVTHAFIGIPLAIVYAGFVLFSHAPVRSLAVRAAGGIGFVALLAVSLPLVFFVNTLRLGQSFSLQNPFDYLDRFVALFARPFWFTFEHANLYWQVVYGYRDAIRPLVVLAILTGFLFARKRYRMRSAWFFLLSSFGVVLCAFVVGTAIDFVDVVTYEQAVYADRLLELATILAMPFFVLALRELFVYAKHSHLLQASLSVVFAALLLGSWYFTYPTRDPVSLYTGYNVRDADIEAVHFIDARNSGEKNYIVLTNQAVAATALKEFGFAKYHETQVGEQYFYSIPTGGPLYQFFRRMVYEQPKRVWMEQAMDFAGVNKAYFVHTNYWAPAAQIRDAAKQEADAWWELAHGRVWVYEYVR